MNNHNQPQPLTEIFNQRLFRVPDYQRGYSWGGDQLEDLWRDLDILIERSKGAPCDKEKVHYTGLLSVTKIGRDNLADSDRWRLDNRSWTAYHVVDGQQRLTTAVILVNELLWKARELRLDEIDGDTIDTWRETFLYVTKSPDSPHRSCRFGYEDRASDEFFKTRILDIDSPAAVNQPKTLYTANLEKAKGFFRDAVGELSVAEVEERFHALTRQFRVNWYEVDNNELDVCVTFETMNMRGKKLSELEQLKNRLIYMTMLVAVDDEDGRRRLREDINEAWKTVYTELGRFQESTLDDDEFLRAHWIMYFGHEKDENAMHKRLFETEFRATAARDEGMSGKVRDYVSSIQKAVKYWAFIMQPDLRKGDSQSPSYSVETGEQFCKLEKIGQWEFVPLLMAAMIRCAKDEPEADGNADASEVARIVKEAVRFKFLVFGLAGRNRDFSRSSFYGLAHAMHKGEIDVATVTEQIRETATASIKKEGPEKIRGLWEGDAHGWYSVSWRPYLRHFLYEYELSLQRKVRAGKSKADSDTFDIERIYPENPGKGWTKHFRAKWKKQLLHSLGNLLLLSSDKNRALKNLPFPDKKSYQDAKGKQVGYDFGSYSEIEVAKNNWPGLGKCDDEWTPETILARGMKMLAFMEKHWGIKLGGEDAKKALLDPRKQKKPK